MLLQSPLLLRLRLLPLPMPDAPVREALRALAGAAVARGTGSPEGVGALETRIDGIVAGCYGPGWLPAAGR